MEILAGRSGLGCTAPGSPAGSGTRSTRPGWNCPGPTGTRSRSSRLHPRPGCGLCPGTGATRGRPRRSGSGWTPSSAPPTSSSPPRARSTSRLRAGRFRPRSPGAPRSRVCRCWPSPGHWAGAPPTCTRSASASSPPSCRSRWAWTRPSGTGAGCYGTRRNVRCGCCCSAQPWPAAPRRRCTGVTPWWADRSGRVRVRADPVRAGAGRGDGRPAAG